MQWDQLKYSIIIVLIILLMIRWVMLFRWKQKSRKIFAEQKFDKKIFRFSSLKTFVFNNFLMIVAVAFIMLALIDVLGGKEATDVKREGSDVVFALDLSNSMNVEDIAPSRLEKAKKIIEKTVNKLSGDRAALIVFTDNAYTVSPLSNDYEALKNYLPSLTSKLLSSQGTNLSSALEEAAIILKEENLTSKSLIILSDGEDHEDENLKSAINDIAEKDITVSAVGIGTSQGGTIPDYRNFAYNGLVLDENGRPVISKIEEDNLKKIAQNTQGKYYYGDNAENTSNNLVKELSQLKKKTLNKKSSFISKHYFQWFLAVALMLIIIVSLTNLNTEFNI